MTDTDDDRPRDWAHLVARWTRLATAAHTRLRPHFVNLGPADEVLERLIAEMNESKDAFFNGPARNFNEHEHEHAAVLHGLRLLVKAHATYFKRELCSGSGLDNDNASYQDVRRATDFVRELLTELEVEYTTTVVDSPGPIGKPEHDAPGSPPATPWALHDTHASPGHDDTRGSLLTAVWRRRRKDPNDG